MIKNSKLLELIHGDERVRVACELLLDRTSNVTEDVLIEELLDTCNSQERMRYVLYRETGQTSFIAFLRDDMSCESAFEAVHDLYRNWQTNSKSSRVTYPYLNIDNIDEATMEYVLKYFFEGYRSY